MKDLPKKYVYLYDLIINPNMLLKYVKYFSKLDLKEKKYQFLLIWLSKIFTKLFM